MRKQNLTRDKVGLEYEGTYLHTADEGAVSRALWADITEKLKTLRAERETLSGSAKGKATKQIKRLEQIRHIHTEKIANCPPAPISEEEFMSNCLRKVEGAFVHLKAQYAEIMIKMGQGVESFHLGDMIRWYADDIFKIEWVLNNHAFLLNRDNVEDAAKLKAVVVNLYERYVDRLVNAYKFSGGSSNPLVNMQETFEGLAMSWVATGFLKGMYDDVTGRHWDAYIAGLYMAKYEKNWLATTGTTFDEYVAAVVAQANEAIEQG